ncbi:MAG: hypothetical protein U0840_16005 [Gemmataceae bacterium]
MELPPGIAAEIRRRIELYRQELPGALSPDGSALRVCGSIGYDAWITPDGDVWLETYDLPNEDNRVEDRSPRAQILVLALGIRTLPELEALLPARPTTRPLPVPSVTVQGGSMARPGRLSVWNVRD